MAQCSPGRLGGSCGNDGTFQVLNAVDRGFAHCFTCGWVKDGPGTSCGRSDRREKVSMRFHECSASSQLVQSQWGQ